MRQLMDREPAALLGCEETTFPWLVKYLDACDWLSVQVHPDECAYWDTKDGSVVAAVKIVVAALGMATNDGGVEGRLRV